MTTSPKKNVTIDGPGLPTKGPLFETTFWELLHLFCSRKSVVLPALQRLKCHRSVRLEEAVF